MNKWEIYLFILVYHSKYDKKRLRLEFISMIQRK